MSDNKTGKASIPHEELLAQILDCRVPKNDMGWAAAKEIASLHARLAEAEAVVAKLPKYADTGKVLVPGRDSMWMRKVNGEVINIMPFCAFPVDAEFYSTEQAAQAGREQQS